DNFGHEYNCSKDYAFSVIGGDTKDPDLLIAKVKEEINRMKANGMNPVSFERSKKKKIGGFLRMLNSPESIANEFTKYQFKNTNLFDILPVYESITLEEANQRLKEHFNWDRLAVSIVRGEKP
ncbi:MAG TPA: peptidase M16, partial [Bacilli bacterium]